MYEACVIYAKEHELGKNMFAPKSNGKVEILVGYEIYPRWHACVYAWEQSTY